MMNTAHYKITVGDRTVESQNQLFDNWPALFGTLDNALQMRVGIGTQVTPFSETFDGPLFRSRPFSTTQFQGGESQGVAHSWTSDVTPDINTMKVIRGIELCLVFVPDSESDAEISSIVVSRTILDTPMEVYPGESVGLIYRLPSTLRQLPDITPGINVQAIATIDARPNNIYVYPNGGVVISETGEAIRLNDPDDFLLNTLALTNDGRRVIAQMSFEISVQSNTQAIVDTGYGCLLFSFGAINDLIRVTFDMVVDRVGG